MRFALLAPTELGFFLLLLSYVTSRASDQRQRRCRQISTEFSFMALKKEWSTLLSACLSSVSLSLSLFSGRVLKGSTLRLALADFLLRFFFFRADFRVAGKVVTKESFHCTTKGATSGATSRVACRVEMFCAAHEIQIARSESATTKRTTKATLIRQKA